MATTPPMIGGSDPSVLKSLETQTPSVARTAPPSVSATTGTATSGGTAVARGIAPQVSGGTTTYNQATQTASGTSLTITSSTSNDPADVVTVYNSPKAISVSAVNQTVNTYKVNNYSGNEYTDSNVAAYLPTYTGNVGAGNVNVTGTVYTSGISSTGLASLTTLNVAATTNLGAVGNVTITGGSNGQVLTTNGSNVLSWTTVSGGNSSYGNSDVANYLPTFTGNVGGNVFTGNLFVGSGANLTNIAGANVGGFVPNANVANTAFAVAAANVSGLGNIATINLTGSTSNVLYGNGVFAAVAGGANIGNVTFDDVTVQGVNGLNLSAGADFTANLAYLQVRAGDVASHIHLDTGNNEAYDLIVGDDQKFVQVSSTGNILMSSYDGANSYQWNMDTTGNLNLPINGNLNFNAGGIIQAVDEDFRILVQDADDDGFALLLQVDDGAGNVLGSTELQRDSFSIQFAGGGAPQFRFNEDGGTQLPGNVRWDTYVDQSLFGVSDNTGNGTLELKVISYSSDTLGSNVRVTQSNAYISTSNAAHTWTFGDDGRLTVPGSIVNPVDGEVLSVKSAGSSRLNYTRANLSNVNGDVNYSTVSTSDSGATIEITSSDGSSPDAITKNWTFDNIGTLTTPGDITVAGDITGTAGANTLVVKAQPTTDTYIQLNSIVDSTVSIAANLEIVTDSSNTAQTWTFGDDGRLTFPGTPRIDTDANNFEVQAAEAISLEANTVVNIYTDSGNNAFQWQFGDDGNLTLPANTFAINYANGTQVSLGGGSSIANGNSNVSIATANGNVTISAVGNTTMTVTGTGANVTGTLTSTGKIGYASGSTVTQITSRGTGVTINALAGTIVTTSASMVATEIDTFSVVNSSVDPNNDIVLAQIVSPNQGTYDCIANPAVIGGFNDGFYINIVNISGFTTADETITIRFMVIKAPNA